MIDDTKVDDFDKYITPARPKRQREYRTDRNNNPIAAAVTTGGRNQFTDALDQAEIPWEHGDQFPNDPKLSTIRIKGDPIEGARAILSNSNALKWYRSTTGKQILPKYGVRSSADFSKLPIEHQNDIINGIYQSEGGSGKIKPTQDDFDKYVSRDTQPTAPTQAAPEQPTQQAVSDDDDFEKYVMQSKEKTPQVSVKMSEGAEMASPEEIAASNAQKPPSTPIPFQQASKWNLHPTDDPSRAVSGPGDLLMRNLVDEPPPQGIEQDLISRRYQTPDSLKLGKTVKVPFPSNAAYPSSHDVTAAYLKTLGPEYEKYGQKYFEQTGRDILQLTQGNVDRDQEGNVYVQPSSGAIRVLNAYVQSGGDLEAAKAEGAKIGQERQGAASEAQRLGGQDIAEIEAGRKELGRMSAAERSYGSPALRVSSGLLKTLGGVTRALSKVGIPTEQASNYLNTKGRILEDVAALPTTEEGKAIQRSLPEKTATAITDLGFSVIQLAATKRATGMSMGQIMAMETALKTSDDPPAKRAAAIAQSYAMGKILDGHLSRTMSAALFGVPAAVEGSQAALRGQKPWEDVVLDVGIQGGTGALMASKTPVERPLELGIERAPTELGVTREPQTEMGTPQSRPDITQAERLGESARTEDVSPDVRRVSLPEGQSVESPRHVDLQPRRVRGDGKGQFKSETAAQREERRAQVTQASTTPPEQPAASLPAEPVTPTTPTETPSVAPETKPRERDTFWQGRLAKAYDYPNGVRVVGHSDGSQFDIRSLTTPRQRDGLGTEALRDLRTRYDRIVVNEITPDAAPFWEKMKSRGLVDALQSDADLRPYSAAPQPPASTPLETKPLVSSETGKGLIQPPEPRQGGVLGTGAKQTIEKAVAAPPEPAPKGVPPVVEPKPPESTTSIKNAAVESAREVMDLPGLTPADHKGWVEAGERAREQGLDQPDKADAIAEQVIKGTKKQLTDEESAGLRDRLRGIDNQYDDLLKQTEGAADPDTLAELKAQGEALKAKAQLISDATKKGGTEVARALAIRRSAVDQNMLLTQLGAERSYKLETGKEPNEKVKAQIADLIKQNKDLTAKIAAIEQRGSTTQIEDTVKRVQREIRRERRQATRKVLDDEAATIKQNIAAEFARLKSQQKNVQSLWGLGSLDPEGVITRESLRYFRNRVEAGITDSAQLLDDVHGMLSEYMDVNKRQVAEMLSGYGRPVKRQSELQAQLNSLRSELARGLREEDIATGVLTEKRQGPPKPPKQGPPNRWPARKRQLERQIAEVERRIREQDFSEKAKRPETIYNAEGNRLRAKLESVNRDFQRLKDASKKTTVADALVRWKRFAVLTYGTTIGKLTSAASGRMGMTPVYETVGQLGRITPGLKSTFADEPSFRAFLKGEKAAVMQLWQGDSLRDFLSHLKGGEDMISLLYGKQGGDEFVKSSGGKTYIPRTVGEVLDRPGHYHAALKTVPKRAAFFRAFERGLQKEIEKPNPRDIRDPTVQLAIAGEAKGYEEAQRAILQQKNWVTDLFNKAVRGLERSDYRGARAFGKLLQFRYPITKVPVNYVGEAALHIAGLPSGLGEVAIRGASARLRPAMEASRLRVIRGLAERMPAAMDDLTPEQRQRIARAIKVGGVGLGFVVWGAMRPDQFGGYYQPGKRAPKDVKAGGMRFLGINIPQWMGHIPPLEAAQFGATMRRVYDSMLEKGKEDIAKTEGLKAATKGLAEEIPFNQDSLIDVLLGGEGKGQKLVGGELRSTIPGAVQQVAKASDYPEGTSLVSRVNPFSTAEPTKRKPESIVQEVEMGLPILRQRVPLNTQGSKQEFKSRLIEQMRSGQDVDLDSLVDSEQITKADKKAIEKQSGMTPFQVQFENIQYADQALDRYERLLKTNDPRALEVEEIISKKAWSLLHSDSITESEREKFQQRIDLLGITPRDPHKKISSLFQRRMNHYVRSASLLSA